MFLTRQEEIFHLPTPLPLTCEKCRFKPFLSISALAPFNTKGLFKCSPPPYEKYNRLFVYHLDGTTVPQIKDPDLIGIWLEDGTPILFFHRRKDALVADLCRELQCTLIYQADLDYADWEAGQEIAPFTVGDITVAPIWTRRPADLRIDPSVIFGSGFHPSTRLCMEILINYCREADSNLHSMLDLGAGTGLLSLTAASLGIQKITACDNNPLACEVAEKNRRINGYEDMIEIRELDLRREIPETDVDLIVANLYHTLLGELFKKPSFWRAGLYIVAGFIPSMEPELLASLPTDGIQMLERRRSGQWCLWVLASKGK